MNDEFQDALEQILKDYKRRTRKIVFDNVCDPKIHAINSKRKKITSDIISDGKGRKGFNKRKNQLSSCSNFDEFY